MNDSKTVLDGEEYLHLALEATRRGDGGAALAYLKEGSARFPDDARLAYMLGAAHAQIGLYDRAEAEMEHALTLDPMLHMARFQLGLLRLTQGKVMEARLTWSGFSGLPADHAFALFRGGLEALSEDRFAAATDLLRLGIAANDFSEELNRDMENVLARMPSHGDAAASAPAESNEHVWLNAYQTGTPTQ
jgi:tetratricopeptide (TPR) repeat protein